MNLPAILARRLKRFGSIFKRDKRLNLRRMQSSIANIGTPLRVRLIPFRELDPKTIEAWGALEERALEKNAYLSPRFVLPAYRHLGNPKLIRATVLMLVEKSGFGSSDAVGVGVFVRCLGTKKFPLPHLNAFGCPHSYLSGLLLDREEARSAVPAVFRFLGGKGARWHGVAFSNLSAEGPQFELFGSLAEEYGLTWREVQRKRRAIFVPAEGGEPYLYGNVHAHEIKEYRRLMRRLEDRGAVHWRTVLGTDVQDGNVERFLELEDMGWKGENGTSLRSNPSHEAFFREMITRFRDVGHVFFTELVVGNVIIASTANLISGDAGFAFKVGWDPAFSKMAPGLLNELESVRHGCAGCGRLSYIDSGAEEGSFIEKLWVRRRLLASGLLAITPIGRTVLSTVDYLRKFRGQMGTPPTWRN